MNDYQRGYQEGIEFARNAGFVPRAWGEQPGSPRRAPTDREKLIRRLHLAVNGLAVHHLSADAVVEAIAILSEPASAAPVGATAPTDQPAGGTARPLDGSDGADGPSAPSRSGSSAGVVCGSCGGPTEERRVGVCSWCGLQVWEGVGATAPEEKK